MTMIVSRINAMVLLCLLLTSGAARGEGNTPESKEDAASKAAPEPASASADSSAEEKEVEQMEAASRRNENVPVYQIDTNVVKELNRRLGIAYEIIPEAPAERSYYAAEFGRSPRPILFLPRVDRGPGWHGEFYEFHRNSIFNARTFFQAGSVQPSRENRYGMSLGGPVGSFGHLFGNFAQEKIRGMVNGNVLVPLASERTPRTTDPEIRTVVERFLRAYPHELPNRTDFDPRALNTNAPQRIDDTSVDLRLDRSMGTGKELSLFHSMGRLQIDAFQLVAGQNPDTEIHTHRSRVTYRQELSSTRLLETGFTFQRTRSVLKPEPNAVGPRIRIARQIEELGPSGQFPIDRAQNSFSWGGIVREDLGSGRHTFTFGADLIRLQLNGIESNDLRGRFSFSNAYGRTAIDNFLHGTPSRFEITLGEVNRGYRNWHADLFFGHRWRATPKLQLYYGLRYGLETTPTEVNRLDELPYGCDCNNFSPRLSVAYRLGKGWVTRASYNLSFGQIYPVTFQQIRNNPPLVRRFLIQNPDLINPFKDIDLNDPGTRVSPIVISPDLVSPYSHQYNLTFEKRFSNQYFLRMGYLGSRTLKLLAPFITNRAQIVPGVPLTRATVDERRPDSRFSDIINIVNGGIGYLDAVQLNVEAPYRNGLAWRATYTFSKALDTGADYSATAANRDLIFGRGQTPERLFEDLKGLSNFDSPHSFLLNYSYDISTLADYAPWSRLLTNGWTISGTALMKSGTPFTVFVGSDSPGFGNVDGGSSDRPNILDPSILGESLSDPQTAPKILSADRFAFIEPGQQRGSVARNAFRKAPITNFNLSATRRWALRTLAESSLLFRVEVYNLTNTPQFDSPNRLLSSEAFGRITNTLNDGRIFQLGLQLLF